MNRYPAWKFVLIAIALVFGLIYTLPNFFPEVPAVQVSSSKSAVRIDNALMVSVEEALKGAGIAYRGAEMDPIGIKVRFADTDTQLKAKDVLQTKLGDNYIVALNLLSASPRWLAAIGALPMYLGLDLRGGVHFLLQVDMPELAFKSSSPLTFGVELELMLVNTRDFNLAPDADDLLRRATREAPGGELKPEITQSMIVK